MSTNPEHAPSPTPEHQSTEAGMPFHWAMAFAFLVFVAMCVAFWCGHSFSMTTMEMFTTTQPPVAPSRR
jgi:hypothetical protein